MNSNQQREPQHMYQLRIALYQLGIVLYHFGIVSDNYQGRVHVCYCMDYNLEKSDSLRFSFDCSSQ